MFGQKQRRIRELEKELAAALRSAKDESDYLREHIGKLKRRNATLESRERTYVATLEAIHNKLSRRHTLRENTASLEMLLKAVKQIVHLTMTDLFGDRWWHDINRL